MKVIEGNIAAPEARVAIVVARFNSFINENLVDGALDVLKRQGLVPDEQITLVRVPGAVEIPLAVKKLATRGKVDASVALG
ncbi:MAG: 6,7-dimethyl-8-ribityllumazine synthase, partial [Aeromonadaceae bacterium]